MDAGEIVRAHFDAASAAASEARGQLPASIAAASTCMTESLLRNGKILACGHGVSANDAMQFTAQLLTRFELERPSLPAVALASDTAALHALANEHGDEHRFARQLQALGSPSDTLLAISAGGNAHSVLSAIHAAHDRDIRVVALTGPSGYELGATLEPADIEIRAPGERQARVQEVHRTVLHCLCDLIDRQLFGAG